MVKVENTMDVDSDGEGAAAPKPSSKLTKREREVYKELCGEDHDFPQCAITDKLRNVDKYPLKIALMSVVKKWAAQRAKEESKKKGQKPRQPTAYNLFFKQQMQKPAIKGLEHSERMKAVAMAWKRVSPHQKKILAEQAKKALPQ